MLLVVSYCEERQKFEAGFWKTSSKTQVSQKEAEQVFSAERRISEETGTEKVLRETEQEYADGNEPT